MGSITYDFLADSLFLNESALESNFEKEKESRIQKELEDYRKHCISNQEELVKEIKERESLLKVFSSTEEIPFKLLKQTALYIDQFIVFDPLFKHSDFQSDITKVVGKQLGYQPGGLNRKAITNASKFLKEITPMIAADYVKIFPLSYLFETPKSISLNLPVDHYNGILPRPIMDFFWENASVRSMKKREGGGWEVDENDLYPCRGIAIDFKNTNLKSTLIYHLFETKIIDFDERRYTFCTHLPDTAPDKEHFNAWVTQSINSASKLYFDKVFNETYIASSLNSTYLCDNTFTNDLLTRNFETKESISTYTASQVMNIELPFLDQIDLKKLMDIRNYEEDVFTNFRLELEKNFRGLRTEKDPDVLKVKVENIFHELNEVQGQKIKTKIDQLKKKASVDFILGVAGLVSGICTSGFSLLATAVALGKGYKDYLDYVNKVKNNPVYLLWKVKK